MALLILYYCISLLNENFSLQLYIYPATSVTNYLTTNEKGEEKPKDKLDKIPLPEGTDTNDFVEKEHPSTILPPPQGTTRPPGNFSSGYSDYIKNYNIE